MKANKMLLADMVHAKLIADVTTSIVTEVFIDSLPFDAVAKAEESENLARYCTNVVETLHPETLLQRAIESCTNLRQKEYLEDLYTELDSICEAASNRIVNSECFGTDSTPEVLQQAKLDDDEVDAVVSASQKSGIDAVAEVIKKKMVDTIKADKDNFEKAEKLRNDILDVISDSKDSLKDSLNADDDETPEADDFGEENEEDMSEESYMNMVLNPTDPRHPVSVFSKLQDLCMESIMATTEEYEGEIPYQTLENITLESTFPIFDLESRSLLNDVKALKVAVETCCKAKESDDSEAGPNADTAKSSMISAICIMTLMEVLKSMNLAKPDMAMVKNFVDSRTNVQNASDDEIKRIEKKVEGAASDIKKSVALGALSATETSNQKAALKEIKDILESMTVTSEQEPDKARILDKINTALEAIGPAEPERQLRTDSVATRILDDNSANLERAIRVVSRRPAVESVNIFLDSATPMGSDSDTIKLKAAGIDEHGKEVFESYFDFNVSSFLGSCIAEAVQECALTCDLKPGHKPVNIYFTDQDYKVPLGEE